MYPYTGPTDGQQGQGQQLGYPQQQPQVCPYPAQQGAALGGPGYPTQPQYGFPIPGAGGVYGQQQGNLPYPIVPQYPGQQQGTYPPQPGYPQQQAYPQQQQNYWPQLIQAQAQAQAYPIQQQLYPQQQIYPGQQLHQQPSATATPAMNQQHYQDIPSIVPVNADLNADVKALRKAMKGFGTDEKAIINILTKRSDRQRQEIANLFKASFGKSLIDELKSELSGPFEKVILALMTPRIDYLAQQVHKAVSGLGTKESVLVDVLCTATNSEIYQISQAYMRLFKTPLEKDLKADTSGHFMRLLVSMCTGLRTEDLHVNPALAAEDAQSLIAAGEKKWGTDESTFNMILATKSYAHLRAVFQEYERLTGHDLERAIKSEFSGDVERGMLAIVKCAKNRAAYFAERIHQSIAGAGTKDNDLIFLVVSRADIDLGNVEQEYLRLYGKSMSTDIAGDTSGDYKKALLGILGHS